VEVAFLGGFSHTEVARILDFGIGTETTTIGTCMNRLRPALGAREVAAT